MQLRAYAKEKIATSHNSYAHCVVAKSLSIPYITMTGYEYQPANHIKQLIINFRT